MSTTQITKPDTKLLMRGREFLADTMLGTIDPKNRTVDAVFFTGIDVPRYDPWEGESYVRRFDPKGADLSLLNNGAPVLDNHSSFEGSHAQKGVVERAWEQAGRWLASLRFAKTADVDEL